MSYNTIDKIKIDGDSNMFPEWYWEHGLRHAVILSVINYSTICHHTEKHQKISCMEIDIDSRNAIYQNDISKIYLYNYVIKTKDFDINDFKEPWWISDTLYKLSSDNYLLEIELEFGRNIRRKYEIEFEFAEVEKEY